MTGEQSAHQETKGAGVQAGYLFVVAPSHDDVERHASASLQEAKAALAAGALSSAIKIVARRCNGGGKTFKPTTLSSLQTGVVLELRLINPSRVA